MALIKCGHGHYYDTEKFSQCPYCGIFAVDEDEKTVAVDNQGTQGRFGKEEKTVALKKIQLFGKKQTVDDTEEKTQAIDQNLTKRTEPDLLAGWLVCVSGPEKGKDYHLYRGFNRIGRAENLDIAIREDQKLSREASCAVVYDDRSNQFFAVQQAGGSAYLNEKLLMQAEKLKTGDRIKVGGSELEFVAFCREGHVWSED
ncbi:FHA domain-containing protein [Brotaphodocola sp.]|uniref:FHA domain-containing protein n=1 Tax=Brotaphodocola sp. TaxID=3073577 RepID=UPI003D7EF8B8